MISGSDTSFKKLNTINLEVIGMTGVEVIVVTFILFAFLNQ